MADEVRSIDLTGVAPPALSTTSDMPKAGVKTEPVKGAVSEEEIQRGKDAGDAADRAAAEKKALAVKAPFKDDKAEEKDEKVEAKVKADDKAEDKDEKVEKTEKEPKKDETPPWMKREMTIARNRQRDAESRAQALDERLDKALTALEKLAARTDTDVKTQPAEPKPERAKFDDPESYDAALIAWSAKTSAKLTQAEIEKQQKEREATEAKTKSDNEQKEALKTRVDAWKKSKEKAIEKYPDWVEKAESADVNITPAIAFSLLEENLETGEAWEVAYYLGNNPEEADKIAALKTQNAIDRAIGRISERLALERKSESKKTVTKAPEPPKPIGSRSRAVEKSPQDETMEEYAKRRNAELRSNPH